MMEEYENTGGSILGVQQVPEDQTHRYGIVDASNKRDNLYSINHLIEKPEKGTAPSNLAIMGRYVLSPKIFGYLDAQKIGAGGEIQLTDAIQQLNENQSVFAYDFEGKRYDVGEKLGFIKTTIEFALENEEIGEDVRKIIQDLIQERAEQSN
jgi:UTP--glucose-1-phosphate uridylyltransferase